MINYRSVPDEYVQHLVAEGVYNEAEAKHVVHQHMEYLNCELTNVENYQPEPYYYQKKWKDIKQAAQAITVWDTGVDYSLLQFIGKQSVHIPEDFVRSICQSNIQNTRIMIDCIFLEHPSSSTKNTREKSHQTPGRRHENRLVNSWSTRYRQPDGSRP